MAVIIGSARCDERGQITGGTSGDQTGREVCTEPYYNSKLGWYILRAKDPEVADRIADDMQWACDNNKIGYDQSNNQSLYYEVEPYGFDCRKVTKPCETDCSQLVRVCVSYALQRPVEYFYTGDEVEKLMATGAFDLFTESKYTSTDKYLKRGDILCTKSKGHTAVALSDGSYHRQKVEEDGIWGVQTTYYLQEMFGTVADGEIWNQQTSNKKYLKNCSTKSWKFKLYPKTGSPFIMKLQQFLGVTADGWCGRNTIRALQSHLRTCGYYTGEIDGYAGYYTVLGVQKWINNY